MIPALIINVNDYHLHQKIRLLMPGNEAAFQRQMRALYSDHHGWLYAWLRRKLRCPADAADLTHDTFLRAFGSRQIASIQEPRAFLTTLGRRVLFTFWRRRELEQAYVDALVTVAESAQPSAEDVALVCEALTTIDSLLDGLSVKVRQAFLLHRLDGMTQTAIARELDLSLATVERYIRQAYLHCLALREQA